MTEDDKPHRKSNALDDDYLFYGRVTPPTSWLEARWSAEIAAHTIPPPPPGELVSILADRLAEARAQHLDAATEHQAASLRAYRRDIAVARRTGLRPWRSALSLLEWLILSSLIVAQQALHRSHERGLSQLALVRSLRLLHGEGLNVAWQVLALLRAGFPEGANARWRSLHEAAVIATLLRTEGDELAERFQAHDVIATLDDFTEQARARNFDPREDPIHVDMLAIRDTLIARYGKSFGGRYGWCADLLGNARPRFEDIEKRAGMHGWSLGYGEASRVIHPRSRSYLSAASRFLGHDVSLAGPMWHGLANPGVMTARSLMQVNATVLGLMARYGHVDMDEIGSMRVLDITARRTIRAFGRKEFVSFRDDSEAASEAPEDPESHLGERAEALMSVGAFARALTLLDHAIAHRPLDAKLRCDRAQVLLAQGKANEAAVEASESIRLGRSADALAIRGAAHATEGRWGEAIKDIKAGLELEPERSDLLELEARIVSARDGPTIASG